MIAAALTILVDSVNAGARRGFLVDVRTWDVYAWKIQIAKECRMVPVLCRRRIVPILISLAWLTPLSAWAGPSAKAKQWNVLFIFSDDQRADTIAALGNKTIKTPHLDRLVRGGTSFTRAYCMGSTQGAVCAPSRAMILTGRHLFHAVDSLKGQGTWPEMFARAGYVTFVTGKWHNGAPGLQRCFMKGSSVFLGGMGNPHALPVTDITGENTLTKARKTTKHSVEQFTDEAVEFLQSHKKDKPFLAYVSYNLPHDPRVAPKEYHDFYNKNKPPLPPNFMPLHPFNNGEMTIRDEQLAPWPRSPEVVRQHLADYYAAITFMDAQIGRILEALEKTGQLENTIIVFASDHGLAIGSHGLMGKQNLYDHSMRAPLIFAGPGIPKDQRKDALVYLHDIYPTLGDIIGVMAPKDSEGASLLTILEGRKDRVRDSLFLAYRHIQRAVRDDRWKLIVYPQINKTQLFDMQTDPHEMKDLSGDAKHAKEIRRLTGLLKEWQGKLGDKQALSVEKPMREEFEAPKGKGKGKGKKSAGVSQMEASVWEDAFRLRIDGRWETQLAVLGASRARSGFHC